MIQLMRSMKFSVMLLVIVCVENVGAIFMATNVITTSQTKHGDIRCKYFNECLEDKIMKIMFVKSVANIQ